jgi:hypothetical protein
MDHWTIWIMCGKIQNILPLWAIFPISVRMVQWSTAVAPTWFGTRVQPECHGDSRQLRSQLNQKGVASMTGINLNTNATSGGGAVDDPRWDQLIEHTHLVLGHRWPTEGENYAAVTILLTQVLRDFPDTVDDNLPAHALWRLALVALDAMDRVPPGTLPGPLFLESCAVAESKILEELEK